VKLSTRSRYGTRAVLELALHQGKGPLQTKIIAERQGISLKYLEQVMSALKSGGFVRSFRGSKGGYILAREANQIKLSEVFNALEGPIITVECLDDLDYCPQIADCIAREVWSEVQGAIQTVLESITLQDLVDRAERKRNDKKVNYQI